MICCNIRIILYKSYLIRGAFPGKTEVCRFAARGMRPPLSLVLPKKTGRARSKRKTPLCPNPSLRSGLDRTGVERDGAPKLDSLLPGALESWGTEMVLPRIWGLGAAFGAVDVWNCFSFRCRSRPLSGERNPKGRGRSPFPLCRFKGVWGKQAKRRQRRMKRACFEEAARLAAPKRGRESQCRDGVEIETPPRFSLGGVGGHFSFQKRNVPPPPPPERGGL